jgi:hypothetical protein
VAGGNTVSISGYRIGPAPTVTIGGRSATVVSQSGDLQTLEVLVPPGTGPGNAQVRVTNGDGLSATRTYTYA